MSSNTTEVPDRFRRRAKIVAWLAIVATALACFAAARFDVALAQRDRSGDYGPSIFVRSDSPLGWLKAGPFNVSALWFFAGGAALSAIFAIGRGAAGRASSVALALAHVPAFVNACGLLDQIAGELPVPATPYWGYDTKRIQTHVVVLSLALAGSLLGLAAAIACGSRGERRDRFEVPTEPRRPLWVIALEAFLAAIVAGGAVAIVFGLSWATLDGAVLAGAAAVALVAIEAPARQLGRGMAFVPAVGVTLGAGLLAHAVRLWVEVYLQKGPLAYAAFGEELEKIWQHGDTLVGSLAFVLVIVVASRVARPIGPLARAFAVASATAIGWAIVPSGGDAKPSLVRLAAGGAVTALALMIVGRLIRPYAERAARAEDAA